MPSNYKDGRIKVVLTTGVLFLGATWKRYNDYIILTTEATREYLIPFTSISYMEFND